MRLSSFASISSFLLLLACLDPFDLKLSGDPIGELVIDGSITDQPGPYQVRLSRTFDVQSKSSFKTGVSARKVTISDDLGNEETLNEVITGIYQTNSNGIRGRIGRIYTLKVQLRDGREYQSVPDTLQPSGRVDSIFYSYREFPTEVGIEKGFDVSFNASKSVAKHSRFLWKSIATYKIDTNPELYDTICADGRCPKPLRCSGYFVDLTTNEIVKFRPCDCCTCWVNIFNQVPIVSDKSSPGDLYKDMYASFLPINQWTFMYHVNVKIEQLSLSNQAYRFWKSVRNQIEAKGSLFQPITGILPNNFIQKAGPLATANGFFYASSVTSKSVDITQQNFPKQLVLPLVDPLTRNSCLKAFPLSSTSKPDFWID